MDIYCREMVGSIDWSQFGIIKLLRGSMCVTQGWPITAWGLIIYFPCDTELIHQARLDRLCCSENRWVWFVVNFLTVLRRLMASNRQTCWAEIRVLKTRQHKYILFLLISSEKFALVLNHIFNLQRTSTVHTCLPHK